MSNKIELERERCMRRSLNRELLQQDKTFRKLYKEADAVVILKTDGTYWVERSEWGNSQREASLEESMELIRRAKKPFLVAQESLWRLNRL
jgi:hypothetical protein